MTVDCLFGSAASQIIIRDYMADALCLIRQVETVIPYRYHPAQVRRVFSPLRLLLEESPGSRRHFKCRGPESAFVGISAGCLSEASTVESAIVFCTLDDHATGPLQNVIMI
ncbi:pleckstrin domain-containing family A member 7 [Trichinella spiralis]|uniref:pleckstrin domain-containing family A member 7 n=1 Tax=Trichinella spiralis TaxID=6334 RepID=UPI0001EFD3B3|nr:pleckstrin domain-containing family A member 7 [Trichinella spiralis]